MGLGRLERARRYHHLPRPEQSCGAIVYWASFVDPSKTAGQDNADRSPLVRGLTMRTTTRVANRYLFIPWGVITLEEGRTTRGAFFIPQRFTRLQVHPLSCGGFGDNQATLNTYKDDLGPRARKRQTKGNMLDKVLTCAVS